MQSHLFLGLLISAIGAHAQSSEGFPFDVAAFLPVDFSNTSALDPGALYDLSIVIDAPTVGLPQNVTASSQPYLVMMVDPDVVVNSTATSVIHWLQPNMYSARSATTLTFNADGANASAAQGASYLTPQPPANEIHRYNVLLFEQPANFTVPSQFATIDPPQSIDARIGFNITDFVSAAGLAYPIAANYFRILLNATADATSSALTMTATSGVAFASSTMTSFSEPGTTISGTRTSSADSSAGTPSAPASSSAAAAPMAFRFRQGVLADICAAVAAAGLWVF